MVLASMREHRDVIYAGANVIVVSGAVPDSHPTENLAQLRARPSRNAIGGFAKRYRLLAALQPGECTTNSFVNSMAW